MKNRNYDINVTIKPMVVQKYHSGNRLDHVMANLLPQFSRSQIKRWILNRQVIVNNQISILPKKKMISGSIIEISLLNDKQLCSHFAIKPQNILLDIIYEDNDILVINKSSNMVVYPGIGNYENTLLNALLYKYPSILDISKHAGIVQRLDKDTSGLMVIAKTCFAYNSLLRAFKMRQVEKEYDALVFGSFSNTTGIINQPIRRHAVKRTCMTVHILGKPSITYYSVVENFNISSKVHILLKTGRTHQIRVHMSYIRHPLIGDRKYGFGNKFFKCITQGASDKLINYLKTFNRQALHASVLQISHPVTQKKIKFYAPLPKDMLDLINILKKN